MWRTVWTVVTLATLVCASAPIGLGANPLDDDADSGGDAGDLFVNATPLVWGTLTGTTTLGIDQADVYAFEGEDSTLVQFEIDYVREGWGPIIELFRPGLGLGEDRPVRTGFEGKPIVMLLDETGTWYLRVIHNVSGHVVSDYVLSSARTPAEDAVVFIPDAAAANVEWRFSNATRYFVESRIRGNATDYDDAFALTLFSELATRTEVGTRTSFGGIRLSSSGPGSSVAIDPVGVETSNPAALQVSSLGDGGVAMWGAGDALGGHARIAAYRTNIPALMEFRLWTDGDWELQVGQTDEVRAITASQLTDPELVLPGVRQGGNATHDFVVVGDAAGFARGGGATFTVHGPSGSVTSQPPPDDYLTFMQPETGSWRIEWDVPAEMGLDADPILFDFVDLPDLDLLPPPLFRWPTLS